MRTHIEPLKQCYKILQDSEVNFALIVSEQVNAKDQPEYFDGGSAWNVDVGTDPDFFSLVAGLINDYLTSGDMPYRAKLRLVNDFSKQLIETITMEGEENDEA